jgi:hypothetical protein
MHRQPWPDIQWLNGERFHHGRHVIVGHPFGDDPLVRRDLVARRK